MYAKAMEVALNNNGAFGGDLNMLSLKWKSLFADAKKLDQND